MNYGPDAGKPKLKPAFWIAGSKQDLRECPAEVRSEIGHAIEIAQRGGKDPSAKPLKGFGDAGVLEVVENHRGDTYRAVYTVRFAEALYVLHVFQKKSKSGMATPQHEMNLIERRFKTAALDHQQRFTEK